ncbi:MAG TPA: Nramp family divalent metal transporter, partial [Pseudonocardia sp.]|nr:Nramp family divalent metal transporter [Pseudonocardia sp.]
MSESTERSSGVDRTDPYTLTADGIKEPPVGWRASFKYLGPGLILSASIVGSGELIATTTLGAEAGFVLLWLVIISTLVKVAVQVELARWTIATGQPALTGYNKVPPRIGRVGWVNVLWAILALSKLLQLGGIIGGVAVAFSILLPIGGDPLGFTSLLIWTCILAVGSIAMLYSNNYSLIERGAVALVVIFSAVTVLIALGLPFTPFPYGGAELASGLTFLIPAGAVGAAVAMFGITGVGADEITFYTYWCVEKGYARWVGPNDGSEEWVRRANGWIRVMYKDAAVSWVIYTFGTLAFYLMGAAVLNPQGLVPEGNGMITTLSRIYTDTLGEWASVVFLIGAIAVLGSTMWASIPSWSRMYTNLLATFGVLDWQDPVARLKWIRTFTVALPLLWGLFYLTIQSPVIMVQIAGVATGIFLVAVVWAV